MVDSQVRRNVVRMDLIIAPPHICVTDVTGTNKSGLKSPITLSSCEDLLILVPSSDSHYRVGTTSSWSEKPTLIKVSTKHLMRCIWGLFIFLHTGYLLKEYNLQDNYWRSDPPWKHQSRMSLFTSPRRYATKAFSTLFGCRTSFHLSCRTKDGQHSTKMPNHLSLFVKILVLLN